MGRPAKGSDASAQAQRAHYLTLGMARRMGRLAKEAEVGGGNSRRALGPEGGCYARASL